MNDSTGVILGLSTAVLFVILYVWYALALSALFAKAGERSWKAWVPFVNLGTVLKLGGFSPWLVLLVLIPLFGVIAFVIVFVVAVHRISAAFDRGAGTTVLGVLLQVVWASVLGFGSARWAGPDASRSRAVDENSAPVRRGQDFAGPYVPLVGGWTPEPPAADAEPSSEPVVLPFAAPSGSLADAVPSSVDWAPSRSGDTPPVQDARPPRPEDRTPDAAPPTSVFDVLDALRADAEQPGARRATAEAAPTVADAAPTVADADAEDNGFQPTVPLTPGLPLRGRGFPVPPTGSPGVEDAAGVVPDAAGVSEPEPWTPPRRADAPAPVPEVPLTRPAADPEAVPESPLPTPQPDADEFPELSEAVSAVPGAPEAGAPRSARTSVAALYTQPEFAPDSDADDLDALDRTVVARRRRIPWALVPPSGDPVELTSSVVIVGRRPAADNAFPDAQLVAIADETRTVSKTHARLQLRGDTWFVTDLDSTNGVLFATLMGTEIEAPPGEEIEAGERFFLGDAEVRLSRRDA